MKKIFVAASIMIFALFLIGCANAEEARIREEKKLLEDNQKIANWVLTRIRYVQDPRTDLCFAYLLNSGLAAVPCDRIPPHLLKVGSIE